MYHLYTHAAGKERAWVGWAPGLGAHLSPSTSSDAEAALASSPSLCGWVPAFLRGPEPALRWCSAAETAPPIIAHPEPDNRRSQRPREGRRRRMMRMVAALTLAGDGPASHLQELLPLELAQLLLLLLRELEVGLPPAHESGPGRRQRGWVRPGRLPTAGRPEIGGGRARSCSLIPVVQVGGLLLRSDGAQVDLLLVDLDRRLPLHVLEVDPSHGAGLLVLDVLPPVPLPAFDPWNCTSKRRISEKKTTPGVPRTHRIRLRHPSLIRQDPSQRPTQIFINPEARGVPLWGNHNRFGSASDSGF